MKISIVLGTRPEIIKLSSVIFNLQKVKANFFIVHTNQHYSKNMDSLFFKDLELPKPKYNLQVGSGSHAEQTAKILTGAEKIFLNERPDIVIVQGDTNSVLAGALSATKLQIKLAHVESGLRSFDRTMPEEINRIITDQISDLLFCPTDKQKKQLLSEGVEHEKIHVVGNTIVDAVLKMKNRNGDKILQQHSLTPQEYILLTMHRPSNVDDPFLLKKHLDNISKLGKKAGKLIIFPIHPRTKTNIKRLSVSIPENIKLIEPVGFIEMISLEKNALVIITDSGGIQEEACILQVPCLNIRENTERPECVEVGACKIIGSSYAKLENSFDYFMHHKAGWKNPFGNGHSGEKIVEIISDLF